MTLKVVNRNRETGLSVVKWTNRNTGELYEFQVHAPEESALGFYVEARYDTKKEADAHMRWNESTRKIWREAG